MADGRVEIDVELDSSEAESKGAALAGKLAKVGAAAASAIGAGTAALAKQSLELYASYEQLVGGVDTLFKDSGEAVKQYADNAYRTAGMSANQYMETVTGFSAALINSLGGDTAAAAEFANVAVTDMADNANKMGTSIDSIQQTYASLARGNYAMLDNLKLGYAGTKEGLEELMEAAEAYQAAQGNMVDYSVDSYADIVSAIHDVQTEMGISGATASEAATTIEGSANAAKAAWENWLVSVADENANMEESTEQLIAAVVTAAENAIPRIAEIVSTLLEPISGVVSALAGLLAGFAAFKAALAIQSAIAAFQAAMAAVGGATGAAAAAQALFNTVLKANPIAVVVSLIATLVAALVTLFATNEDFRAAVTAAWENVKQVASDVWGAVVEFFTVTVPNAVQALFDWFSQIPGTVQGFLESALARVAEFAASLAVKAADAGSRFVSNVVGFVSSLPEKARAQLDLVISRVASWASGLVSRGAGAASSFVSNVVGFVSSLPGRLGDMLSSAASRAASFASDFASSAFDGASRFVSNIVSALSGLPDRVYSIGSDIVSGIWNGISGMVGWMRDRLFGFADSVLGGIKSALGIASPSKVMRDEVGRWMAEGIYVGFEENDPMGQITASVSRGVTQLGIMAQMAAAGGTAYSQTVNFNQPVQSPDEFARAMRMQQRYGLAGAYV